jgi:hypothetical protein
VDVLLCFFVPHPFIDNLLDEEFLFAVDECGIPSRSGRQPDQDATPGLQPSAQWHRASGKTYFDSET